MADNLKSLFRLDPDVTFLNHGSYGACPRAVFSAYQGWQELLERQPVAFMNARHLGKRFAEVREALGKELGAPADDLVAVPNATAGLNAVARSLPLNPGDEILMSDHEYNALHKTWDYVTAKTGAIVRKVTIPLPLRSEAAFTQAVLAGITEKTRVLFLSHITSPTALLFPIERAVKAARAQGIWTVIDGAHAPGHIPLDLSSLGADFYAGNCHKWLMAPKGSAFLYARPEVQDLIDPAVISHGWSSDRANPGPFGYTAFQDRFQYQGTRDHAAFLSVPAAIDFRYQQGWNEVAARCRDLALETASRLQDLYALEAISTPEFSAPQMIAMPIPGCDTAALYERLKSEFGIEIPVFRWNDRCFVRVSVQGYNSMSDLDHLCQALPKILPAV